MCKIQKKYFENCVRYGEKSLGKCVSYSERYGKRFVKRTTRANSSNIVT